MKKEIIPYVGINQVNRIIKEIPSRSCKVAYITNKFGRSTIANILPTLVLLKLVEYNNREKTITLTKEGEEYRRCIVTKNYQRASKILMQIISKIELFDFLKGLLERKRYLTSEEIGKELAFKYGKNWKTIASYRAHGSACASILSFAGYGIYESGVLKKDEIKKGGEKLPSPHLSFNKILKILNEIGNEEIDLKTLSDKLRTKPNRLGAELSVCVELGLVKRLSPGKFAITPEGRELIDPLNFERRNEIWRNVLLNSRYKKFLILLKNRVFTLERLGAILKHHWGGKWKSSTTVESFTKKFYSWLKAGNFIHVTADGKYKLVLEKEIEEHIRNKEERIAPTTLDKKDFYLLGKFIGIIYSSNNSKEIEKAVNGLIKICGQIENLNDIMELIQKHLSIFQEMNLKNGKIFEPDIDLLVKKLGVEDGVSNI